jgi:adenylate cyclase
MKRKTEFVERAVSMILTALLFVNAILHPGVMSVTALCMGGILILLTTIGRRKRPNPLHPPLSSTLLSMPHSLLSRNQEIELVTDRLVLVVEDLIKRNRVREKPFERAVVRQELHRHLGSIFEETPAHRLDGQNIEATILLSDLRGFSFMTQGCSAQEVVDMLNRYFTRMCEIIYDCGGTVDKFMGDSIMALFGAPWSSTKEIEHAACCAAQMQIAMDAYNKENEKLGFPNLYMGIGINTGEAVIGKIGSDLYSDYTVVGDEVNLTSRIEAHSLRGQILLSGNTYERIKDLVKVKEPISISVKGKSAPVCLYELLSIGEPYNLQVPDREARRTRRVDVSIPFEFQVCEGRAVRSGMHEGRILNISAGGMFASTSIEVEPYSNVRFRLKVHVLGEESHDIYGTILRTRRNMEFYEMNVEFTMIDPRDRNLIKKMVGRIVSGGMSSD